MHLTELKMSVSPSSRTTRPFSLDLSVLSTLQRLAALDVACTQVGLQCAVLCDSGAVCFPGLVPLIRQCIAPRCIWLHWCTGHDMHPGGAAICCAVLIVVQRAYKV